MKKFWNSPWGKSSDHHNYGYGSMYNSSEYSSHSGWETSFYGGYTKMVNDHPHIILDRSVIIRAEGGYGPNISYYIKEKIAKMYLLKMKELGLDFSDTPGDFVVKPPMFGKGKPTKFFVVGLKDTPFETIIRKAGELSPLFAHYKQGILETTVEQKISEVDEDGDMGKGNVKKSSDNGDPGEEKEQQSEQGMRKLFRAIEKIEKWEEMKWEKLSGYNQVPRFVTRERSETPRKKYRFTGNEIRYSEILLKMLDIDFEPKSDVVKNLRIGKLDISKISEVPAGNVSIYKQTVEEQDTRPFSFCILADLSGSMGCGSMSGRSGMQFTVMNTLYLAISQILPPDKFYIYGHTGSSVPTIHTYYSPHDQEYEENIREYDCISFEQNYDGPVIEAIHKKIREHNSDRIIFLAISDGQPSGHQYGCKKDREDLKRILERCRRDEFVTLGVGIESVHVKEYYTYSVCVKELSEMARDVSAAINNVVRSEFR